MSTVTDFGHDRVEKFSNTGNFLFTWGTTGSAAGMFNGPDGIAFDGLDGIYVADVSNHRIQKFSTSGSSRWTLGAQGSGDGEFEQPTGVALNSSHELYVADHGNNRIQKFGEIPTPSTPATLGQVKDHYRR